MISTSVGKLRYSPDRSRNPSEVQPIEETVCGQEDWEVFSRDPWISESRASYAFKDWDKASVLATMLPSYPVLDYFTYISTRLDFRVLLECGIVFDHLSVTVSPFYSLQTMV